MAKVPCSRPSGDGIVIPGSSVLVTSKNTLFIVSVRTKGFYSQIPRSSSFVENHLYCIQMLENDCSPPQNFCVPNKTEIYTVLEQHEGET